MAGAVVDGVAFIVGGIDNRGHGRENREGEGEEEEDEGGQQGRLTGNPQRPAPHGAGKTGGHRLGLPAPAMLHKAFFHDSSFAIEVSVSSLYPLNECSFIF